MRAIRMTALCSVCCAVVIAVIATARPALPQSPPLTIKLTGQAMVRSDFRTTIPAAVPVMTDLLKGADVVFTNFEATIARPGQPNEREPLSGAGFLTPPATLDAFKAVGINLIATANNHGGDLKVPGILNTIEESNRVGITYAGTGKTLAEATAARTLKTPRGTVALIGIASGYLQPGAAAAPTHPGVNELRLGPGNVPNEEDSKRILQSIRDARATGNLVIVSQHNHIFDIPMNALFTSGLPGRMRPPEWLKKWVRDEIDAGADLIVMHGAPILHGIEIYKGKPIFYDLGNFIFNTHISRQRIQEPMCWESVVPAVEFQGRTLKSISLRPIVMNFLGQGQPDAHDDFTANQFVVTRGLPAPAKGDQAKYILERMAELSQPFGTKIAVKGDVAIVDVGGGR